jgi:hypothetical protein
MPVSRFQVLVRLLPDFVVARSHVVVVPAAAGEGRLGGLV